MLSKWHWLLLQLSRRLWVQASLYVVLGAATALASLVVEPLVPADIPARIGAGAVQDILEILASSMLAVTTFSLGVMVTAYGAATSNVTPRATTLLIQDRTTQNVLATFIGAFLFSLVGIVGISAGAYGDRGRVVLFVITLLLIAIIVITILRWIDHLARLGRVGETTSRVEAAAAKAMRERASTPCLGGAPLDDDDQVPDTALRVSSSATGYVQHIDVAALDALADRHGLRVFVAALPGAFMHVGRALAHVDGDDGDREAIGVEVRSAFTIGDERSFDQDPRFGLVVLSEIASRALSPAVNDPGTAIDVIGRQVRVLTGWVEAGGDTSEPPPCPRVHVPRLRPSDLFDDAFLSIARDGAGLVEVQLRLLKGLRALAELGGKDFAPEAARHALLALKRSDEAGVIDEDRRRLVSVARSIEADMAAVAP